VTTALLHRAGDRAWLEERSGENEEFFYGPQPGQLPLWQRPGAGVEDERPESADASSAAAEPAARSLELVIGEVWSDLQSAEAASCPACGGAMHVAAPGGAEPAEGYCGDCGASLS
jgi:hypothetical protein